MFRVLGREYGNLMYRDYIGNLFPYFLIGDAFLTLSTTEVQQVIVASPHMGAYRKMQGLGFGAEGPKSLNPKQGTRGQGGFEAPHMWV